MHGSTLKRVLMIAGVMLLLGSHAVAERQAKKFTLSPTVGYHVIDGGMSLDDAATFGLGVGYNVTQKWALEADLRYTPTETDSSNSVDLDIWTASLGGLYHFTPGSDLTPYLSFGAGFMSYDPEHGSSDEDAFGYYGGGLKLALLESTDLRLDARHILDYRSDNRGSKHDDTDWRHHLQATVGVTYQFGTVTTSASQGQIAAPIVKEEIKNIPDSDNDGVLAPYEMCPDTAPGVRVGKDGCPADTDSDGIKDYLDACVDTPQGSRVDERGCPEVAKEALLLTRDILFGFDKDQVTPFHYNELQYSAEVIDAHKMSQVVVEGHADDRGTDEYNILLSQRRAENVRRVLIDKYGIPAHHIKTVGFGLSRPIAGNATAEERMKNRRVEISLHP